MSRMTFVAAAIGGALLALSARAAQITALPEGPDRDLVSKVCQSCHDLDMVLGGAGASRQDWDSSLEQMASMGMSVTAEERSRILEYLATYLGPSPPKPATAR